MNVAVVGGGAAGCMAAGAAARRGARVTLFESNERLLKKVFITGGGRCNVTNYCDNNEFLEHVVSNPRFLYSALSAFGCYDAYAFFEELRVPLKVERGNRVFPASDKSGDVVAALARYASAAEIVKNRQVADISRTEGGLAVDGRPFDAVILATGGKSYPATGSRGDGYAFAAALGHTVVPPRPALVGLRLAEDFCRQLSGLTLKNVSLRCREAEREIFSEFGELLFTREGISGPMALSLSSRINRRELKNLSLSIDLKPALAPDVLDARILRDFGEAPNRAFRNSLAGLLPKSLIPVAVARSGISPDKPVNRVTAAEREGLGRLLKDFRLQPAALGSMEEAIVTAGGVEVSEVNPKTMESKLVPGLYFAGEILDVDAETGGFNLQIAFSTGRAAGLAAAGKERFS